MTQAGAASVAAPVFLQNIDMANKVATEAAPASVQIGCVAMCELNVWMRLVDCLRIKVPNP